jgi:hypothetical protein
MKKITKYLVVSALFVLAAAPAMAQQNGSLTVAFTPGNKSLDVPALTGPVPGTNETEFTNDGRYGFIFGDTLLVGRFGVAGSVKFGKDNTIDGGTEFLPSGAPGPRFNPTSGEKLQLWDIAGTFALINTASARVDATAGYFYANAKPLISEANTYGGPTFGVQTKYLFRNGLDVHGKVSLAPTFFVHGNVEDSLLADSFIQYRIGADYAIVDHFGVSAGFDGFKLSGTAAPGNPLIQFFGDSAVVKLSGFYFGGQAKW